MTAELSSKNEKINGLLGQLDALNNDASLEKTAIHASFCSFELVIPIYFLGSNSRARTHEIKPEGV
jgi:hypothetical protein